MRYRVEKASVDTVCRGNVRYSSYMLFENMSGVVIHRKRNVRVFSVEEQDLNNSPESFEDWFQDCGISV